MEQIHIGNETDYLQISIDKNLKTNFWLDAIVEVKCGVFFGTYPAQFVNDELHELGKAIKNLEENLGRSVKFDAKDGCLVLELRGDGLGHIHVSGKATDYSGAGFTQHYLNFSFTLDQTFLPKIVSSFSNF